MIDVNLLNDNTVVDVNLQTDDISIDLDIDSEINVIDVNLLTDDINIDLDIDSEINVIDINLLADDISIDLDIDITEVVIDLSIEQGSSIPNGGLKRQSLIKKTDTNNDYAWKYRFEDYLINVEYTGTKISTSDGSILEAEIDGNTIFRYITNNTNTNGYPLEDSFYNDEQLNNLIITRE
tara:strand:+ start:479 stop:1018 length:540 start_codon:yes stop_codon:yes gene_type:complete